MHGYPQELAESTTEMDRLEESILSEFGARQNESGAAGEEQVDVLQEFYDKQQGNKEAQMKFDAMVKEQRLKQGMELEQIPENEDPDA